MLLSLKVRICDTCYLDWSLENMMLIVTAAVTQKDRILIPLTGRSWRSQTHRDWK